MLKIKNHQEMKENNLTELRNSLIIHLFNLKVEILEELEVTMLILKEEADHNTVDLREWKIFPELEQVSLAHHQVNKCEQLMVLSWYMKTLLWLLIYQMISGMRLLRKI